LINAWFLHRRESNSNRNIARCLSGNGKYLRIANQILAQGTIGYSLPKKKITKIKGSLSFLGSPYIFHYQRNIASLSDVAATEMQTKNLFSQNYFRRLSVTAK